MGGGIDSEDRYKLANDNTFYCEQRKTTIAVERCMDFQLAEPDGCSCTAGLAAVEEYTGKVNPKTEDNSPPPEAPRAHDQEGIRICEVCEVNKVPSNWNTSRCMQCARAAKTGKGGAPPKYSRSKSNPDPGEDPDPVAGPMEKTTVRSLAGVTVAEDKHGNIKIEIPEGPVLAGAQVVGLYYILADIARARNFDIDPFET